jgi:hypothetical protein
MSAFDYKTIIVKGDGIRKEGELAAGSNDITPGMFVARAGHNFFQVTSAGAASRPRAVAEEAEVWGGNIDTDYDTEGERVLYRSCVPGMEVFALLAAGQNVAVGAALETAAGGTLTGVTAGPVVAHAMEAVDNSAGADPMRILVEIV